MYELYVFIGDIYWFYLDLFVFVIYFILQTAWKSKKKEHLRNYSMFKMKLGKSSHSKMISLSEN